MAITDINFNFVTVMDVEVWKWNEGEEGDTAGYEKQDFTLDSLSISNISIEGPEKEARGGQEAKPLIRYRKTGTLEMEDVLMKADALQAFMAAKIDDASGSESITIDDEFATSLLLKGTTSVINSETGAKEPVDVIFYDFLPNSVFDLTMEAEGDIGMINISGELFAVDGKFYTIKDHDDAWTPADEGLDEYEAASAT
ncbi:MAG: hypothetical protein ACOCRO_03945 [Halanaerobiales bacterium]